MVELLGGVCVLGEEGQMKRLVGKETKKNKRRASAERMRGTTW